MNTKTKENILWCLLAVACSCALLWQFIHLPNATDRLLKIPVRGPGFYSTDLALSPDEKNIFSSINLIKRLYSVDGEKYFVYVLDGTENRHLVHDPTYCFRGDGWEISSYEEIPVDKGFGGLYTLKRGSETKEALFWFSDGKIKYAWPIKYWLQATLRRLSLGWSGEEPLLFVIQPLDTKNTDWKKDLHKITSILDV